MYNYNEIINFCKKNNIMDYLEKKWSIKKNKNYYIFKKNDCIKILFINVNMYNKESFKNISTKEDQIIVFIFNTLQKGWTIKKKKDYYIFKKKNDGNNIYYKKQFLNDFIFDNLTKI